MQRSNDQTRVEFRDVATENRFQPGFTRCTVKPVTTIATVRVPILSKIAKQLEPVTRVIVVKRSTPRSFDAKPNPILIHYASNSRERQTVITQRLPMPRRNCINIPRGVKNNLFGSVACFSFIHGRETCEPLAPKLPSLE